jgi:uncharacterized protein with ATP-grasp and redox domains
MKLMESTLDNADLDPAARGEILQRIESNLLNSDHSLPPARNAGCAYHEVLDEVKESDLFLHHKRISLEAASELYPRLKDLVENASDPLDAAFRVSALGNILDVAVPNSYDIDQEIDQLLEADIVGDGLRSFRDKIKNADGLLLLADNAGETIFDRVLIETLPVPVVYAVKSGPAFDDALVDDALKAGIDQVADVIETGTIYPGTYLPSCSPEFQKIFTSAQVVLAKGQANYETLNDADRDLFFLLKVKCDVVSSEIGIELGNLAFVYKE